MPELPEVEGVRRTLAPALLGRVVRSASLERSDIIRRVSTSGHIEPKRRARATGSDLLVGEQVVSIERVGKQLLVVGEARALGIHLGMSGQVLVAPEGRTLPIEPFESGYEHIHARLRIDGAEILYRDPRRFGCLTLFQSIEAMRRWCAASLGPDALTITRESLATGLSGSRRAIKAALLDQRVLAGVGNIYADEALFASGIAPHARALDLRSDRIESLARALRTILTRAIESGGSTLRNYTDALGERGRAQEQHAVYGRAGEACVRCGSALASEQIAQRTTVWCRRCQTS